MEAKRKQKIQVRLDHYVRGINEGKFSTHDNSLSIAEDYTNDARDLLSGIEALQTKIDAGEKRILQIVLAALAFFDEHGKPSKLVPSCLGCGAIGERSTEHLSLPNVYLCKPCVAAIRVAGR